MKLEKFAVCEGIRTATWLPGTDNRRYSEADTILVPVDRHLLDEWQKIAHQKSRSEALGRLLEPDKPKIIFANPDILFRILALRYHAEAFGQLHRYQTLILERVSSLPGCRARPRARHDRHCSKLRILQTADDSHGNAAPRRPVNP